MKRVAFLIGLHAIGAAPAAVAQAAPVELRAADGLVYLRDLAVIPESTPHLADRLVARIQQGEARLSFEPTQVANVLRRHAPGLQLVPRHGGAVTFVAERQAGNSATAHADRCFALSVAAEAGDFITASVLRPVDCDPERERPASLTFDRHVRAVQVRETLPAGTYLGKLAASDVQVVPEGSEFVLRVRAGPVVVEREVRTLQAARAGEQVFAVAEDGTVLSARLAGEGQ